MKRIHCSSPARKLHKQHDGRTIKVRHLPLSHFAPTLTHHVQAHLWHQSEGFMLLSTSPSSPRRGKQRSPRCCVSNQQVRSLPGPYVGTVRGGREKPPTTLCNSSKRPNCTGIFTCENLPWCPFKLKTALNFCSPPYQRGN